MTIFIDKPEGWTKPVRGLVIDAEANEGEYRRGYRDGVLAVMEAVAHGATPHDLALNWGPLNEWMGGDCTRLTLPPVIEVKNWKTQRVSVGLKKETV
jgi:hypothetical protein